MDRLEREARMRLFQQLHQNDDPDLGERRRRPNGKMRCPLCCCQYREHPPFLEEYGWGYGGDYDPRLCTGEVVHL